MEGKIRHDDIMIKNPVSYKVVSMLDSLLKNVLSAPDVTRGFTSKYGYDYDALPNFLGGLF